MVQLLIKDNKNEDWKQAFRMSRRFGIPFMPVIGITYVLHHHARFRNNQNHNNSYIKHNTQAKQQFPIKQPSGILDHCITAPGGVSDDRRELLNPNSSHGTENRVPRRIGSFVNAIVNSI
nr:hypothetical protein Itr_chr15CG03070 [Ipomoea trifida]